MKRTAILLLLLAGLAGCGGGSDDEPPSTAAPVYTSDQEANGTIRCTGACTAIWIPVTSKSAASDLSGKLGTVKRPDGTRQVTLDGRPLYRFAEDSEDGKATGDGVKDSFGGVQFTWHAESGEQTGGGGGGGRYSY